MKPKKTQTMTRIKFFKQIELEQSRNRVDEVRFTYNRPLRGLTIECLKQARDGKIHSQRETVMSESLGMDGIDLYMAEIVRRMADKIEVTLNTKARSEKQ